MKVLFVEPKQNNDVEIIKKYNLRPVGLRLGPLFLASYLRSNTNNVDISIQENRLREVKGIDFSIEKEIQDADVIAVSSMTNEFPDAYKFLKIAKQYGKVTVMGGLFPSANPEFVLNTNLVDYIVHGEGEKSFTDLILSLMQGNDPKHIKGISLMRDGVPSTNPDAESLDNIDFSPAYDLISASSYAQHERGPIMTARGCPYFCSFCTLAPHWKRKYRTQSLDSVLEQFRALNAYKFKRINIIDETFTINRERTVSLLKALCHEYEKGRLSPLPIKIKARLDTLDRELLGLFKHAKIEMIQIGVETVNQERLNGLRKGLSGVDIENTLDMLLEYGFAVNPIFIFGYNGQTQEDLQRDVAFIKRIGSKPNVTTFLSFNTPHPGTENWNNTSSNGLHILTGNLNFYNHKMLVCTPRSLNEKADVAAKKLQEAYNDTVSSINMEHENPLLDNLHYIECENKTFSPVNNIWF